MIQLARLAALTFASLVAAAGALLMIAGLFALLSGRELPLDVPKLLVARKIPRSIDGDDSQQPMWRLSGWVSLQWGGVLVSLAIVGGVFASRWH